MLILACASQVILTLTVCMAMLVHRVMLMKKIRLHPQAVALSADRLKHYKDTRLSDNYNHLFELPVVFYVLCMLAIICQHVPNWLVAMAWGFVFSRVVHSLIQCTYNRVMHRFSVFFMGLLILIIMWLGFIFSYIFN
jgi:hypothetical protein